jgi:predicted DNA-binding antitoxin AbrB/MazE fold protein
MSQEFEAVFERGVLRPLIPPELKENQRVRVVILPIDDSWEDDFDDAVEAIRQGFADLDAGRTRPFEEFDREFRARPGIPPQN